MLTQQPSSLVLRRSLSSTLLRAQPEETETMGAESSKYKYMSGVQRADLLSQYMPLLVFI